MTPPMTRPMGPIYLIIILSIPVMITMPLARRDDWLAYVALVPMILFNVVMWPLLIMGIVRQIREKWRGDESDPPE